MNRVPIQLRIPDVLRQTKLWSVLAVVVLSASLARAQQTAKPATGAAGDAARGKYLVESVAMCVQCHTPRNGDGTLDRTRLLQGAPVIWAPGNGDSNWPLIAPRIGGSMPASDADMIKLLTTGVWTTGQPLRLPMMPFRMNDADARAVVAYLKTVTSPQ